MKAFFLILFATFLTLYHSQKCTGEPAETVSECTSITIDYGKCCFAEILSRNNEGMSAHQKICAGLTFNQTQHIDELIEEAKENAKKEGVTAQISIDCGDGKHGDNIDYKSNNSNYMSYSLLSLILLFL